MPRYHSLPTLALVALTTLGGCKILPTPTEKEKAAAVAAEAFNPDKLVEEDWSTKVVPYLKRKAGTFQEVVDAAKGNPAAAGEKYGNPKKQANSPWTYVASAEGKIVASNTESRAATIDVDVDGDGKGDLRAQIGPAIRGTALRDTLDFVDFNSFKNQIDFAQYGKSFNTYANKMVLSKLPREGLDGKTVKLIGAFVPTSGADLPLLTPVEAEIVQ
jgi:predicted lipoprotein